MIILQEASSSQQVARAQYLMLLQQATGHVEATAIQVCLLLFEHASSCGCG
jgi:hypothetical protein